eukprot:gene13035-17470_t
MRKYRLVAKKGEGTFSEVLKAQNVKDGKYHAIKCMKNRFESIDQVNNLREIQALRRLSPHEHIITLEEVLYDQPTGRLALVFELMDANLYELIRGRRHYLNPNLIKSNMWQLMKSLDHMHKKGIFHRDIKPENILIESTTEFGKGLKLADFGSCRGIYSKQPYTEYISTRWYRAPECLLTDGYYGPEMDLWGAGCVMFEITSLYPLFPGTNEIDQISRIHKVLGTPSNECLAKFKAKGASHISFDFPPQKGIGIPQLVPHASPEAIDLMVKLLKYDASERMTAREAMRHPYFKDIREAEAKSATDSGVPSAESTMVKTQPALSSTIDSNKTQNTTTGKPLPVINTQDPSQTNKQVNNTYDHTQQQALQKQSSGAALSSLPPILPSIQAANGTQQKLLDQQKSARSNAPQGSLQQQQQQLLQTSNTQKKRGNKKYKGSNYTLQQSTPLQLQQQQSTQQQKNRNTQNSESVLRAYGVPKPLGAMNDAGVKPISTFPTSDNKNALMGGGHGVGMGYNNNNNSLTNNTGRNNNAKGRN